MEKIRNNPKYAKFFGDRTPTEEKCLEYILKNATKNDPVSLFKTIDNFCKEEKNWLMNIGPEKGALVDKIIKDKAPKTFLELGTYIGYSAVRFSQFLQEGGTYVTIDVNPSTTEKAKKISEHAGITNIDFRLNGLQGNLENLKKSFPSGFDIVFLDHVKSLYVSDLNILEKAGLVRKGTMIISDNLLIPGCPEMFEYMKDNAHYTTQYYDSVVEYTDIKDTFGVSLCVKGFK